MKLIIVTGLSGAGRSSALRALEDLGIRCVDNLPPSLLDGLVELASAQQGEQRIAVGVDSRGMGRADAFLQELRRLEAAGHDIELIFLEADDATLLRRYSETRRRHPLGALPDAIRAERELLAPIREAASVNLDTANLRARELRQLVGDRFGGGGHMRLVITSFGFKKGLPPDADLVFDGRGLDNPHWDIAMRPLSGFHPVVEEFVLQQPAAARLLDLFESHIRHQVPASVREGRMHLTVAIGCTGGQHRSVVLARELSRRLRTDEQSLVQGLQGGAASAPTPEGGRGTSADPATQVNIVQRHRDVDRSRDDDAV